MTGSPRCTLVKECRSDAPHRVRSLEDDSEYRACETHVSIARLHDDYAVLGTPEPEAEE